MAVRDKVAPCRLRHEKRTLLIDDVKQQGKSPDGIECMESLCRSNFDCKETVCNGLNTV
jgi:hypothetical protein